MKIPVLLLALTAATPTLAQTPDVPAVVETPIVNAPIVNAPVASASAPDNWEFAPDFLRDQNRIIWSALKSGGASNFFVTTTNSAGDPVSETIVFRDFNYQSLAVVTAVFDKRGKLKDQMQRTGNVPFLLGTDIGLGSLGSVFNSVMSVQTVIDDNFLQRRVFTFDTPKWKGTLTSDYDARGRRQRDILTVNGAARTINYVYDVRGLSKILDGATTSTIERDANGKMRSVSATKDGLLTRSATPIKNDKGAIIGTRTEDYQSGILQEVNEFTQQGGTKSSRTGQTSSDKTTFENGQQTTEKKFEFRVNINSGAPAVAAVESRKRTLYKNAKIASEELFRNGKLTQRSEFNDNGIIECVTTFDADGRMELTGRSRGNPGFYFDGRK